jgi:hypothetical protein
MTCTSACVNKQLIPHRPHFRHMFPGHLPIPTYLVSFPTSKCATGLVCHHHSMSPLFNTRQCLKALSTGATETHKGDLALLFVAR